jgi:hypothetical protein
MSRENVVVFKPKALGFYISIILEILVIVMMLSLSVISILNHSFWELCLTIPIILFVLFAMIKILSYKIIIDDKCIIGPKGFSVYKRYSNDLTIVQLENIISVNYQYESKYRMSYFYLVIKSNKQMDKIDLKLFSKKQAKRIKELIENQIYSDDSEV